MAYLGSFVRKLKLLEWVPSDCYESFTRAVSLGKGGMATAHGFEP